MLSDNELDVCTRCRHGFPVTDFHISGDKTVHNILYGRVDLQLATSLLHFSKKGTVQELMHNLKYRGHDEIGTFLGKWLGAELSEIEDYTSIDVVVPVPLHKSRLRKRGYNQVENFGKELAISINAKYVDYVLKRTFATKTQVFKDRIGRSTDSEAKFSINESEALTGKHILLVDDIITTGATIEACAKVLNTIPNIKLSLATMAVTD